MAADLLAQVIEVQNRLTAPLAPFFLGQGARCPLSLTFGRNFIDYYPLWLLTLLFTWTLFRFVFSKFSQRMLRRMGVTPVRSLRSSNALWTSGTAVGAMMLCASQLETFDPLVFSFPTTTDWPPPHLAMYLAVLATCQVQNFFFQLKTGHFGSEILTEATQIAVVATTYFARWADFGFLFCFYLSCLQMLLHLCRLGLSIRRGAHYGTLTTFYFFSLLWLFSYLFCVPMWIYSVATGPLPEDDLHFGLISLLSCLVLHFTCALAFSPVLAALKGICQRRPMREWLEASLFPNIDWKLTKLKRDISEEELSRQSSFKQKNAQGARNVNQGKALMQILRCSTMLKKKVNRMRERKESTESDSSVEEVSEEN